MNKLYSVLIFLVFFGLGIPCASAANITSFIPQTVEMDMGLSHNVEILKDKVSDGTLGFNAMFSVLDSEVVEINTGSVLPVANFSTNVSEGYAPLVVQFNDSSKNTTGWHWDFGDGANSTEKNPTHIYTVAGTYTVNLTASNEYGTNSTLVIINVFENMPFPGYTNPPKDSDNDGFYEDINGDGNVGFDDVVAYYTNML